MSFLLFKLLFAGVVIALLLVAGLIVRSLRRKRQGAAPRPQQTAPQQAAPARSFASRRQKSEEEAEPAEPAAPRRRQLKTFADAERVLVEPGLLAEPIAPAEKAPPPEPEQEPAAVAEVEAEPADEPADTADGDYGQVVLDRLEQAFEALQAGEITLSTYRARVVAEEAEVEQRIAALQKDVESDELDAALAARESVRWCLNWADEQAG
jgi:hypothetical protein